METRAPRGVLRVRLLEVAALSLRVLCCLCGESSGPHVTGVLNGLNSLNDLNLYRYPGAKPKIC